MTLAQRPSSGLPLVAATGIWFVSVIGFVMLATVLIGALFGDVLWCGDPGWAPPESRTVSTVWSWVIIGLAALSPIGVAAAVANPGRQRGLLVPVAGLVAGGVVLLAIEAVGTCLALD